MARLIKHGVAIRHVAQCTHNKFGFLCVLGTVFGRGRLQQCSCVPGNI